MFKIVYSYCIYCKMPLLKIFLAVFLPNHALASNQNKMSGKNEMRQYL